MKIIAFTFAGGNKYSFQKISNKISGFTVLQYPNRNLNYENSDINDIECLVQELFLKVKEEINNSNEYMIYGHSMGALIGYLVCRKIQEFGLKAPIKLTVSGRRAPFIKRERMLHKLPDNEFWDEIIKLGGVPDELKNNDDLIEFYVPILRSDFSIIENYSHINKGKLSIPIDVFYGKSEGIEDLEIKAWKNESSSEVTIQSLEGNHFFIFDHIEFFVEYFNSQKKKKNV